MVEVGLTSSSLVAVLLLLVIPLAAYLWKRRQRPVYLVFSCLAITALWYVSRSSIHEASHVLGYIASMVISAAESAVVVGGLSAIGAALFSIGIPKDSVIRYEAAIKADRFLVMAHGTASDMARAKSLLAMTNPSSLDVHTGMHVREPSEPLHVGA